MGAWQAVADELIERRYGALVGYALLLTRNRHDAEELVQDALIATFTRRARFDSVAGAEAYVRRAIASRFVDMSRSSARRLRRERAAAPMEAVHGPDAVVEPDPALAAALAQLAPRVRACVVLRYLSDQSIAQISDALGIAEGTVKRNVYDGVRALAAALGTDADEEDLADVVVKEVRS
ncbi:RNA polymerase sigma factor [Demequina sp.]|uniref:RNA polymerase sigma factor n=1 Tax=Demequina sp. TaxID=2050685 RepID=UPI003D0AA201